MKKAYFYIKGLFNESQINDGATYQIYLQSFKYDTINQLTADFYSQLNSAYVDPLTNWGFSDCSDDGTQIDACGLGGLKDSWNPFSFVFNSIYDNVVNGEDRGAFLESNSGDLYGLEGKGFGFDKLLIPINDIPSGGSTGASSNGAFYVNFDETKLFEMIIRVDKKDSLNSRVYTNENIYTWNPTTKEFSYTIQDVVPEVPDPPTDATEWAFLSGGNAGWIGFGGPESGTLGDDPIVTESICLVPVAPTVPTSIVLGDVDECCYQSPVLASTTSNEEFQNDINSFLFKRNFDSETITLTLQKNGVTNLPIVNDDYGIYYDFGTFGDYPNYKGIQIQWQKVLILEGPGTYRIKVESNFVTGATEIFSIPFVLSEYTQEKADGTFRVQSIQNGYLQHVDFDFSGLNWVDGLRVRGFFGNRQAEYEQENVLFANRDSKQIRSELINTYVCQTMHIPDCITDQIIEYHNFANELLFTDYNLNNHKKTYVQKSVVFDSMESIDYKDVSTFAPLQLKYKDSKQNYLKTNC